MERKNKKQIKMLQKPDKNMPHNFTPKLSFISRKIKPNKNKNAHLKSLKKLAIWNRNECYTLLEWPTLWSDLTGVVGSKPLAQSPTSKAYSNILL